ncbi:MAG: helix-turn-helix domain-containing protein [Acidimicrobiales bacterium]|nr:helix-turn-helix domain-containing protein [Acidimicrobiales bacterium]
MKRMDEWLTTEQAAARLGVKRETLYAYVSRGLLHRALDADGRRSRFDPAEIDQLRRRQRPEGEFATLVTTRIARPADEGVYVRGRDLVAEAALSTFEEAADRIWQAAPGEPWPSVADPDGDHDDIGVRLPKRSPLMDRLRIGVTLASATDPLRDDLSPTSVRTAGRRAVCAMVNSLPRRCNPQGGSVADTLWCRLARRQASQRRRAALNRALVLLAEHGLASSTLGARVAASVRADPYSVITAGLGVLGGRLHGAASAPVHRLLAEAARGGDAASALGEAQRNLGFTPGFGHVTLKRRDARCGALMEALASAWPTDERLGTVLEVYNLAADRTEGIATVDFALGAFTYLADMTPESGEAIFAIARTVGWIAHALEEYDEEPLRFRFRARYIGD